MRHSKIRLLLITDHYTPKQGIASQRMAAFAKYLLKLGFDVSIFTDGDDNAPSEINVLRVKSDHWLAQANFDSSSSGLAHKFKAARNRTIRWIQPDQNPGFYTNGLKAVRDFHKQNQFQVIVSSYSSLAAHKLAYALKSEFRQLYWVADFRDEMSQNFDVNTINRVRLLSWEKRFLQSADMVTSVSAPILAYFQELNPHIPALEVRNGYDFEPIMSAKPAGEQLQIVYAGSLYGIINLENFLKGWQAMPLDLRQKLNITVLGAQRPVRVPTGLSGQISFQPRIPYSLISSTLAGADGFLLVNPLSRRKGVYTGKLFDYLAINRPILALTDPADVAAKLVWEASAGYVVANEDIAGISRMLSEFVKNSYVNAHPQRNWEVVKRHHRQAQVEDLGRLIAQAVMCDPG